MCFIRPLWLRRSGRSAVLEVREASQPEWLQAVRMAVVQARAPMPVEVCLDWGGEVRLEPLKGVASGLAGQHRLVVGSSWIGVCGEGELIASVVASVGQSPKGLAGRCFWLMEGVRGWLERAASGTHQGKILDGGSGLAFKGYQKRIDAWWEKGAAWRLIRGFDWLTRRPVWLMLQLARVITGPARRGVERACDASAARLLGGAGFAEVLRKRERLRKAVEAVGSRIEEGLRNERLPDNLVLQAIKELASMEGTRSEGEAGVLERCERAMKAGGAGLIGRGGSASQLVRRFQEISRQLTQTHYEHDLGVKLGQVRLVAVGEAAKRKVEEGMMQEVQRYFEGMAHAHRGLCGLVEEGGAQPTREEQARQVETSRRHMRERADQVRTNLREWSMAWQRCRDLEMAHAYALAGMPLDAREYGLRAHEPALYREEIARQEMIMEHSDDALRSIEADMERRLAAALGLLMSADGAEVPEEMREAAGVLPLWGAAYGVLCGKLPAMRRLRNLLPALESLGISGHEGNTAHAEAGSELEAAGRALDYLSREIQGILRELMEGLERVPAPTGSGQSLAYEVTGGAGVMVWETRAQFVAAGPLVTKAHERCEEIHQTAFAWLCRVAEAAEQKWARGVTEATTACERAQIGEFGECEAISHSGAMRLATV